MLELAHLQRTFLAYLRTSDAQVTAHTTASNTIKNAIISSPQVSAEARLSVYRNAYILRLQDALQESFPALHTLLGDDGFDEMTQIYIQYKPSQHYSLRYFGHQLGAFLSATAPYQNTPVLAEMAHFEWSIWAAFDAFEQPMMAINALTQLAPDEWDQLQLTLQPSCQFVDLYYNVPQLWQAIQDEQDPIAPQAQAEPQTWLIWRKELRTFFRSLSALEYQALQTLPQGNSLAELCATLSTSIEADQLPLQITQFLQQWLTEGLLSQPQGTRKRT